MSSRGLSMCGKCAGAIRWTVTDAGKRSAMDPEPDATGNTAVYRDALGVWRSRRPTTELPINPWEKLYVPHVVNCRAMKRGTPAPAAAPATELPAGVVDLAAHRRNRGRRP